MNTFISISFLIGMIFIIFGAPYQYAKGVTLLSYGECTKSDKVKCAAPFYNLFYGERLYDGGVPFAGIASICVIVFFVLRLYIAVGMMEVEWIQMPSMILFIVMAAFWYFANARATYRIIKAADTKSMSGTIVYSIFFPLGQFYIGNHVAVETRNRMRREETF